MSEEIIAVTVRPGRVQYLTLSDVQFGQIRRAAAVPLAVQALASSLRHTPSRHRRRDDPPPATVNPKRAAQKAQRMARRITRRARR